MYVLPDPVGACTTTSFPCCNARTASCCHRSGITNPAPNPGVILGRCLHCDLLAIGIGIWRTNHAGVRQQWNERKLTARSYVGAGKITRFMLPRRRAHMIFVPSGDQRGLTNSPAASVSCITPLPSRFITKSWNRSFTLRENTTRLPSLDHAGQPSSVLSPEML